MTRTNKRMFALILPVMLFSLASPTPANADVVFTLNQSLNGATPTSTAPWMTAVFQDLTQPPDDCGGNPACVLLTLTSSLEVGSEFITQVAFNVKPNVIPSNITITNTTPGNPIVTSISKGAQNAQNIAGLGSQGFGFDFLINWETANNQGGVKRFNGTDEEEFRFVLTGLTAADFDYANASGVGMAAKVQGIGQNGSLSGVIGASVPDGGFTLMLLGGALIGLDALRRRMGA